MSALISLVQYAAFECLEIINSRFADVEPWKMMACSCAVTYILLFLLEWTRNPEPIVARIKRIVFAWLRKIPFVKRKIENELTKMKPAIHEKIHGADKEMIFITDLPKNGFSKVELIETAQKYHDLKGMDWSSGKVSGAVFSDGSPDLRFALKEVFDMFAWSNPLHPHVYPGCRKMEAEVVRMCCQLFNGDQESCGTMSTGGTVSILLACLAYRNRAYSLGIKHPEMVIPVSAHAAFDKAGETFGIGVHHVQLNRTTLQVNVSAMRRAINSRTCMIVGSAPGFPHGVMDQIEKIAALGHAHNIPVHVDACLGGWLLPFLDCKEYGIEPFDFRVPGVTSITSDSHKYGLAPKGSSVVLYRSKEYLHHQYFCATDWPGGIYASSTMEGSRSGSNIAICWATMLYFGKDKYIEMARKIADTTKKLKIGMSKIEGLEVMGCSDICIAAFKSSVYDIYALSDKMGKKDWHIDILQYPPALHVMVTINQTKPGIAEMFLDDMKSCILDISKNPQEKQPGAAAMYGMAAKIPDRSIVSDFTNIYLDCCYSTEGK